MVALVDVDAHIREELRRNRICHDACRPLSSYAETLERHNANPSIYTTPRLWMPLPLDAIMLMTKQLKMKPENLRMTFVEPGGGDSAKRGM